MPPISCGDCELSPFTVYAPTVTAAPDAVCLRRREVRLIPQGRTFIREGDNQQASFILYSGWAFTYKQIQEGRRQIFSFLIPGDVVAMENFFFPSLPLPFSVKSLTQVSVCVFSLPDMAGIMRSSTEQETEFSRTMQRSVGDIHRRLIDIGRRSASGRIAQLLLELEGRLKQRNLVHDGRFEFPVRQEHFADALGLTTVYVNRTLVALRKRGIIAFDRHHMTILDFNELQRIAQEE